MKPDRCALGMGYTFPVQSGQSGKDIVSCRQIVLDDGIRMCADAVRIFDAVHRQCISGHAMADGRVSPACAGADPFQAGQVYFAIAADKFGFDPVGMIPVIIIPAIGHNQIKLFGSCNIHVHFNALFSGFVSDRFAAPHSVIFLNRLLIGAEKHGGIPGIRVQIVSDPCDFIAFVEKQSVVFTLLQYGQRFRVGDELQGKWIIIRQMATEH